MHEYAVYDVFCDEILKGNPLAVVFEADDLSGDQMQAIAAEFNLSETIFICAPENRSHSAAVRIFTPKTELPFAGHPTVGGAIALAEKNGAARDVDHLIVLEEEVGPVRCAVRLDGKSPYSEFDLPRLASVISRTISKEAVAAALNLTPADLFMDNHEITVASAGLTMLFVPVSGLGAMGRIRINLPALDAVFDDGQPPLPVYAYCRETVGADSSFHARMFSPYDGIPEDPATGSAVAAFSAVIRTFDGVVNGPNVYWIEQGVEMGRPSRIRLELSGDNNTIRSARIGGHAVKRSQGTLLL